MSTPHCSKCSKAIEPLPTRPATDDLSICLQDYMCNRCKHMFIEIAKCNGTCAKQAKKKKR